MPFLNANALENDPKGITLLRAVIGDAPVIRATPSWKAVPTAPALLPALTRRPRFSAAPAPYSDHASPALALPPQPSPQRPPWT
jgi:hypothetical protein